MRYGGGTNAAAGRQCSRTSVAFVRGVRVSTPPQPSAASVGDVTTLRCTLGYKPPVSVDLEVEQSNTVVVLKPTTLSVSPGLFAIGTQNGTAQLQATVKDQLGNLFLGAAITWSSNDPRVTVSNTGLVTGIGTGAQAT